MPDTIVPSANQRGLIPIVLGMVGHRNLRADDIPKLKAAFKAVLDEFDAVYPMSPKVLLSPLAPGADQLAAEVALKETTTWSVRAPLPFEPKVFVQSTSFQFEDEHGTKTVDVAAQEKFNALLGHERLEWYVVPMPLDKQSPQVDWARVARGEPGETSADHDLRRACYANPGGHIVRQCQTLIAFWDEKDESAPKPSGTAEIVRFQLSGEPPVYYPCCSDEPLGFAGDRGPVIVLHTPRAGTKADPVEAGTRSVRVPSVNEDEHFGTVINIPKIAWRKSPKRRFWERTKHALHLEARRHSRLGRFWEWLRRVFKSEDGKEEYDQFLSVCQNIDEFNEEARSIPADEMVYGKRFGGRLKAVDEDVEEVFPNTDGSEEHCPALRSFYRRLLEVRETAGHRAGRLAPMQEWAAGALFVLLFLALLTFHHYAHPMGQHVKYWVLLPLACGIVWMGLALWKDWAWWAGLALFVLTFLPLLMVHFQGRLGGHEQENSILLLAVFTVVWLALAVMVVWVWSCRLDDRRLDYRALAEALRVRRVWVQAGIGRSVASSYLGQLRSEVVWVRRALQHLSPPPEYWRRQFDGLPDLRKQERLHVASRWVQEQERQHEKGTRKEHNKAFWYRTGGFFFAVCGLIVLTLLWTHPSHPAPTVLIFGSLLIVVGGLLIAVCERQAHEELSKQYERMHVIFQSGMREMKSAVPSLRPDGQGKPDISRAQIIIAELGREAIQENAQWLILRRSRPLELPLGG